MNLFGPLNTVHVDVVKTLEQDSKLLSTFVAYWMEVLLEIRKLESLTLRPGLR
jgi:hypothetical protein